MPRRLAAVPDAPPRALGIIRVSKEREEMVSPQIQRAAIEDHCARRGYQIIGWREGLDESGSTRRSRWWAKLDEAVGAVESGDADVLVVWRFSRAARQRLRWAVAIDRVEVAGGLLESATEPLDTSTASGRLARGMLAEFAAYEAETIGNTWREVHARRTARGLPSDGHARFGYRVVDGLHRPFEPEASALASLYRRYVAGESMYSLTAWLNGEGFRTPPGYSRQFPDGGPWTQTRLPAMLDRGFGAGFLMVRGSRQRGAHEPVIDGPTWVAYLAAREARRPHRARRSERSKYLLSGLCRCAFVFPDGRVCGSPMSGGAFGSNKALLFRCVAAGDGLRHYPATFVAMSRAEQAVWEWLVSLAERVDEGVEAELARTVRAARRRSDAEALAREAAAVDRSLSRLALNQADEGRSMPEAVFRHARDELLAQRARLERQAQQARADAERGDPALLARSLVADWETLPVEQRRGGLRELIARVEITPPRPARIVVVPAFAG